MGEIENNVEACIYLIICLSLMKQKFVNLQNIFRWLHTFNIKAASESKQRKVAKAWSGDNLIVEDAPFTFPVKDKKGVFAIKTAAWGYINDLPAQIMNHLDSLKE